MPEESLAGPPDAGIDRYAYRIGRAGLLSPVNAATELLDMRPVYWVPNLPRHVTGVANVHGFVVPVLDLALLFDPAAAEPARWLLLLGSEKAAVALQIPALPARRRFRLGERREPAGCPPALAPHIRGAYADTQDAADTRGGGGPVMWLDFDHRSYFDGGTAFS